MQARTSVLDFIPTTQHAAIRAGTSTYDCTTDIRNAIANVRLTGAAGAVFFPLGRYRVTEEIDTNYVGLIGEGPSGSEIWADTTGQRSIFKIVGQNAGIDGLFFNANGKASHCLYLHTANSTAFRNCWCKTSVLDNVYASDAGNNSGSRFADCWFNAAGTEYAAGSASTTSGSAVATIAGAADLTTLGIRPGHDYIKVGTGKARTVQSVASGSVTVAAGDPFDATASGASYKILMGNNVLVVASGDNSLIQFETCMFQNAKGSGLRDLALYGTHDSGCIYEEMQYGKHVGIYAVASPQHSRSVGGYFEGTHSNAFCLEAAEYPVVAPAACEGDFDAFRIPFQTTATRPEIKINAATFRGQVYYSTADATLGAEYGVRLDINNASATTVNLPAMTGNKQRLGAFCDCEIVTIIMNTGTVTFKSPDSNVNGIAGSTGKAISGASGSDWKRVSARYTSNGWMVG